MVKKKIKTVIPLALRNRGGGKEVECRENDETANALTSVSTDSMIAVCLTPWDCESKRIYGADGVCGTLYSGSGGAENRGF